MNTKKRKQPSTCTPTKALVGDLERFIQHEEAKTDVVTPPASKRLKLNDYGEKVFAEVEDLGPSVFRILLS